MVFHFSFWILLSCPNIYHNFSFILGIFFVSFKYSLIIHSYFLSLIVSVATSWIHSLWWVLMCGSKSFIKSLFLSFTFCFFFFFNNLFLLFFHLFLVLFLSFLLCFILLLPINIQQKESPLERRDKRSFTALISYVFLLWRILGPLERNCLWTLLTQLTDRF